MKEIEKLLKDEFDDIIQYDKENAKISNWLSWGNYALNYISSKSLHNGVPQGKITGLSGLSGTGKSLLALSLLKNEKIDYVILFETEGSPVGDLLNFIDVDLGKINILKAETFASYRITKKTGVIEEIADGKMPTKKETDTYAYKDGLTSKVRRLIHHFTFNDIYKDKNILIIVDSLANLQSVRSLSGGLDTGKRGQDISNFFRSFDNAFEKSNIYFVFTNKLYQSFNPYQPWVESGGVSVLYNPSLSILLENTAASDDLSESESKAEQERMRTALGRSVKKIKATIKKSRFGTEARNIPFLLDFTGRGVSRIAGLFTLLNDFGIAEKNGSKYIIPGIIDEKFWKKDFAKEVLKDEENIINKLQKKLEEREEELFKVSDLEIADIVDDDEEIEEVDQTDVVKRMERDVI